MTKTQINAINRIIKKNEFRAVLQGIYKNKSGKWCAVCDFYGVRLNERPKGIQEAPGIDHVDRLFEQETRGTVLELPAIDELNKMIKENKKAIFDFGENLPHVSARYLREMLRILPGAVCYCNARGKNRGLLFESSAGDGILMPLRKN